MKAQLKSRRLTVKLPSAATGAALESTFEKEVGDSDLIRSSVLTVDSLCSNLRLRHEHDLIYTLCGTILVAVNPYKPLPIYGLDVMRRYKGKIIGSLPPHIFAVADQSFRDMVDERRSVSVIISGESGAGKTENTKLLLNYVSSLNNEQSVVEARLIESASLLESFGNAKTVRNNNSSRFGKLIKILFNSSNRIAGAEIETYLLERSRVSHRDEAERNFHVFYELAEGATPEDRARYSLDERGAAAYNYTSGCKSIEGQDEKAEFAQLKEGLNLFGFSEMERDFVFGMVASILHLGNITFGYNAGRQIATLDSADGLEVAARLLRVPAAALQKVLVERSIAVRGQTIRKGLLAEEAAATRDALCRSLFGNLFDWIVRKLNECLRPVGPISNVTLGVLDIFGFENFNVNSLEQLCINYANEKLHALFIEQVFTLEQQEYVSEGLKWTKISSSDNADCINLIEGKMGMLTLLDEESKLQSGTDASFLKKMVSTFTGSATKCFKPARLHPTCFVVSHFAEDVSYQSEGFREKNQNILAEDVMAVVWKSDSELLRTVMSGAAAPPADKGTTRGINSIGATFRRQLIALKKELDCTKPFFVRCIKPNALQKADMFEDGMVASQLAYSGMVETVKIRAQGFPHRIEYPELLEKYNPLGIKGATQKNAHALMMSLQVKPELFAAGNSKLFLKSEAHQLMEKRLELALRKWAVKIQAFARMIVLRSRYVKLQAASALVGRSVRIVLANKHLRRCVVAALAVARCCEETRRKVAARKIVRNWRAVVENRRLRKCVVAALACAERCETHRKELRRLEQERLRKAAEEEARREMAEREAAERKREEERAAAEKRLREEEEEKKKRKEEARRKQMELLAAEDAEEQREQERLQRESKEQEELARREKEDAAKKAAAVTPPTATATAAGANPSGLGNSSGTVKAGGRRGAPPPPPHTPPPLAPDVAVAAAASAPRPAVSSMDGSSGALRSPRKMAPPPPPVASVFARGGGAGDSEGDSHSQIDDELQPAINEVNAMTSPDDPMQTLSFAKALQRRIKGQPQLVADAMYQKTVEFYRKGLESFDDCDAFINCGTALINQANLRSVMDMYPSKSQACIPLLDLAMRMLEKALTLGLDAEGREAIQLRLRKCEELKDQALDDDVQHLSPRHLEKLVSSIQRKLDLLKVQEKVGKVKKETPGLMGRTSWKEFVLLLSLNRVQWFVKDTKANNVKGEILLTELTSVKETVIDGKASAFVCVGTGGYYPFQCSSRGEAEEWVHAINTNMQRLKLLNQIARLTIRG